MEIAIKRSFLLPSNEIYTQTAGFYDYGPAGALLKHRIEEQWRSFFLRQEGNFEVETATILPEIVLKASGHAANFADPLVSCAKCKNKFRADHLIEEAVVKKAEKHGKKESGAGEKHNDSEAHRENLEGLNPQQLEARIKELGIKCPQCGGEMEGVGWFNLMFRTNIGPVDGNTAYARPETAQGIFLDFPRIYRNYGGKLPIAIGQVGKSYRNEISPRQGLVRLREFTQMELEYFFNPKIPTIEGFAQKKDAKMRIAVEGGEPQQGTAGSFVADGTIPNEILAYFMAKEYEFYAALGLPYEKFWFRKLTKQQTPHYSGGNFDMEVETSYGVIETIGNAYRTDYDLSAHAKMSKQDLSVFVEEEKAKIIPHVVEPSMGSDRLFWCVLEHCFRDKSAEKDWEWFDFPPAIAPFAVAVFPLMKKDGLAQKAQGIAQSLRQSHLDITYSESGSIGRRYARADEIGTPYCLTIDYDTLDEKSEKFGTVTIRYRNDGKQERLQIADLAKIIKQNIGEGKTRMG